MDRVAAPSFHDKPPTSSTETLRQSNPSADNEISASTQGIEGTQSGYTDTTRKSAPDSSSTGTGTQYDTHMKGTAAPGSHSELFGLSPNDGKVHPPNSNAGAMGSGLSNETTGMSGRERMHESTMEGSGMAGRSEMHDSTMGD